MTVAICTIEVSWLNLKIEAGVVFSTSHFFPVFHSNPVCFLSTELHILVPNSSPMIRRCICLRLECSTHTSHGNNLKNVPPCSYRYFTNFCSECPTFSGGNCDMRCLNLQLNGSNLSTSPYGVYNDSEEFWGMSSFTLKTAIYVGPLCIMISQAQSNFKINLVQFPCQSSPLRGNPQYSRLQFSGAL